MVNIIPRVVADNNAFAAYNVLFYDLFCDGAPLHDKNIDIRDIKLTSSDIAAAESAAANLASSTSYALSGSAVSQLAFINAVIREYSDEKLFIDPRADIMAMTDDKATGKPMYPDYPEQVQEISEEDFRSHQAIHYASTYGVEFIALLLGQNIDVMNGWMPTVSETEKTHGSANANTSKHIVDIAFSGKQIASVVRNDLLRPARMSSQATNLAAYLYSNGDLDVPGNKIAFHENTLMIIEAEADGSSKSLQHILDKLCQHPGDVLKAILYVAEMTDDNGKAHGHLSTAQKKAFCRSIERFSSSAIASNAADLSARGSKALNMLSIKRFGGNNLSEAHDELERGIVRSFSSRVEMLFAKLNVEAESNDGTRSEKTCMELVSVLAERPGIMLRTLRRLMENGVPENIVRGAVMSAAESLSPATLVRLATIMRAVDHADSSVERIIYGRSESSSRETTSIDESGTINTDRIVGKIAEDALRIRLSENSFPFAGKKVFVDPHGFSLAGSVVMPNDAGNTSIAYPPAGFAYELPNDGTVRFFTFWDDKKKRVDIDLHFAARMSNGGNAYIGWNNDYVGNGMTFSGDITTSNDSAEFLDVDLTKAEKFGVEMITQEAHIYDGAQNWRDITKCFSGALLVDDTSKEASIYDGRGVLFHDDLNGDGKRMVYATISVKNRWVRIVRGANIMFYNTEYALDDYINTLLGAHGCTRVGNIDDCDAVLSVGRSEKSETIDGKPIECLIDNGFYLE